MRISYGVVIIGFALFSIGFSINDVYGAGFIKFDGVDGESVDKDHKGWSDLLSISETSATTSGSLSSTAGNFSSRTSPTRRCQFRLDANKREA